MIFSHWKTKDEEFSRWKKHNFHHYSDDTHWKSLFQNSRKLSAVANWLNWKSTIWLALRCIWQTEHLPIPFSRLFQRGFPSPKVLRRTNVWNTSNGFGKNSIWSVRLQNLCWGHIYCCLQSALGRRQERCGSRGVKVSNGRTSGENVAHSCRRSWHLFAVKFISRHWDMCVRHASHIQDVFAKLWGGCWGHGDLNQPQPQAGGPQGGGCC